MDLSPRRLFIALPVDDKDAVRSLDSVCGQLKKYESFLKIVPAENYHITLKFFGPVKPEMADSITDAFLSLDRLKKVEYKIEGLGAFPRPDNPSVVWAGLKCDNDPLMEIFQKVEELGSSFGFPAETKKFIPHLTLARIKRDSSVHRDFKNFIMNNRETKFAPSAFRELVLFESVLKRTGAEYSRAGVIKLL